MNLKALSALGLLVAVLMMNKVALILAIAVEVIDSIYSRTAET